MSITAKRRAEARQQKRIDAISGSYSKLALIMLGQSAVSAVAMFLILAWAFDGWMTGIIGGLAVALLVAGMSYVLLIRETQTVIANIVTLTGEPAKVRERETGRFVPTNSAAAEGKRMFMEI